MSLSEAQNTISTIFLMVEMNDVKHFVSDADIRYVTGELRGKKYSFAEKSHGNIAAYMLGVDGDIRILTPDPKVIVNALKLLMKNKTAIIPKSIPESVAHLSP